MKRVVLLVVLLVSFVMLSACGSLGIGRSVDSPEMAANEWLQALATGDGLKLDDLTCAAQVGALQNETLLPSLFGAVADTVKSDKSKVDLSTLQVSQVELNGDAAKVKVTGRIRAGEGLSVKSQVLDQTWVMAREQDKWRFCGLPQLTTQDLRRIVLQPSEVQGTLYYYSEDVNQELNGSYKVLQSTPKPQALVLRQYELSDSGNTTTFQGGVVSLALLFQSPNDASQALGQIKNRTVGFCISPHQERVSVSKISIPSSLDRSTIMTITSPNGITATGTFEQFREGITATDGSFFIWLGNRRLGTIFVQQMRSVCDTAGFELLEQSSLNDLGAEGFGFAPLDYTSLWYFWRINNALLIFFGSACPQSIILEEDARSFALKMQSHVNGTVAPEPLPTLDPASSPELGCPEPTPEPPTATPVTSSP